MMLDHYYTPRDSAPSVLDTSILPLPISIDLSANMKTTDPRVKPTPVLRAAVVDLSSIPLEEIAFDCDSASDDESGSDDGYVSTLLRLQREMAPAVPRRIAGARRVARAASATLPPKTPDVEMQTQGGHAPKRQMPEGELFQSITAITGLESTSFEELRLETYLQSLIATGSARPQPASAPALVIPPAFSSQFFDWDGEANGKDVEMVVAPSMSQRPPLHPFGFAFRSASFPSPASTT
ncbi:unnamed protein product [Mycena citricolor]|uniref:Uncharacterized protein n=1 Tax=Mycena citricolor TaxID=2018698 RepID=A0AAD2GVP2_9AGAR|nr:unnamed protein product [Mycena citricolor]